MGQTSPDMEMTTRELRQNVEMAFNRLDTNGDGVLTREEFIEGCLQDPEILRSLENFQLNIL